MKPVPVGAGGVPADEIPTLPELDDSAWFGFGDMWRDLPYDYSTLLENVLDAGHVPFTHHGTVSRRYACLEVKGIEVLAIASCIMVWDGWDAESA